MKVIAIVNQKGGVAKTTTTHNLGVAMAAKGKRVLLIDLDSQASLTISVGMEPLEVERTIVDVLKKDGASISECIEQISERLHIVTSIIDLAPMEMELLSRASREKILDRALKPVRGDYDFILMDCPPQLSILTINALSCADYPGQNGLLGVPGSDATPGQHPRDTGAYQSGVEGAGGHSHSLREAGGG